MIQKNVRGVHSYRDAIGSAWKSEVLSEELESARGARKAYSAVELK